MWFFILITAAASLTVTFLSVRWLIPKLSGAGFVGKDVNKEGAVTIPEMGGFGIISGLSIGILFAVGITTFYPGIVPGINIGLILASLSTILLIALVGIIDDLFAIRHIVKATLPLIAALPLVAVKAGESVMSVPFLGSVDFGILYILVLVPAGVAGASNVTNMLAGFNGLEAGMGLMACTSLAVLAFVLEKYEALILLAAMAGALVGFLYYNWYPAKVFIGDIGALSIGVVIASAVIIGDFESAGLIVIIPYAADFFIKAKNRFPTSEWWGVMDNGKLTCPGKPVGLCQSILKVTGGVSEVKLVSLLIATELFFGVLAIVFFLI